MASDAVIKMVADLLEKNLTDPSLGDKSYEDISEEIVSALHAAHRATMKEAPPVLRVGLAFKVPWSDNALHVAYLSNDAMWVTWAGARQGWLGRPGHPCWANRSPSRATKGGASENKDGYAIGQVLRVGNAAARYRVAATTETSVLLKRGADLMAEPNEVIRKHFKNA